MKLITHYIFTTGILTLINSLFIPVFYAFLYAFIISITINFVIDRFGHKIINKRHIRIKRTHSVDNSIFVGLLLSLTLITLNEYYYNAIIINNEIISIFIDGLIAGPSHLFLDAFTCGGIFVKKNRKWKRFAFMHLKYNNKIINLLSIFSGMLFIIISIKL